MDIIRLERIEKLGTIGDVVSVKDGYARNFLLPQKKALRANDANRKVFEANRDRLEKENADRRSDAEKAGETLDVVAGLADKGHEVDKKQVVMGAPIKALGVHNVTLALHPEVRVTIKANVA